MKLVREALALLLALALTKTLCAQATSETFWQAEVRESSADLIESEGRPLFWVRSSGYLHLGQTDNLYLQTSGVFGVLANEQFIKELGLEAEESQRLQELQRDFTQLLKEKYALFFEASSEERRLAILREIQRAEQSSLDDIRQVLSSEQEKMVESRARLFQFYLSGPLGYAKEEQLSAGDVRTIEQRLKRGEVRDWLKQEVSRLERETLAELVKDLPGDEKRLLVQFVETASPLRDGVLFSLFADLADVKKASRREFHEATIQTDRYQLEADCTYKKTSYFYLSPIVELIEMASRVDRESEGAQDYRQAAKGVFEESLRREQLYSAHRRELSQRMAQTTNKEEVQFLKLEELELQEDYYDGLENLVDELIEKLTGPMQRQIKQARLASMMQRVGPVPLLFSDELDEVISVRLGKEDLAEIEERAPELREELAEESRRLQRETLARLYHGTELASLADQPWLEELGDDFLAPLELLRDQMISEREWNGVRGEASPFR